MTTHFRDDFTTMLADSSIPREYSSKILGIVDVLLGRYNISEKETGLATIGDSVNYLVTRFIASKKLEGYSDKTLYNKTCHLKHFFSIITMNPSDIRPDDVRRFIFVYSENRKISSRSLNKVIENIHTFFAWAASEGYIDKDPMVNIKRVKEEKYLPKKVLTSDELESIREVAARDPRDHALIEMLYSTGGRISEIANLKWSDFSADFSSAHVLGKGRVNRDVLINTRARRALLALRSVQRDDGSPYVFKPARNIQDGNYKPVATNSLRRDVKRLKEAAGVYGKVSPHTFRRTMATNMLSGCGDIASVQKLLGHASIQTTTIYAQVSQTALSQAHSKFIA